MKIVKRMARMRTVEGCEGWSVVAGFGRVERTRATAVAQVGNLPASLPLSLRSPEVDRTFLWL